MVQCDTCSEWFHFECLSLDPDSISDEDPFFCPSCLPKPKITVGFGPSGAPSSSAAIAVPQKALAASLGVAHSLPARFASGTELSTSAPHALTPSMASPAPGIRRPARKRTKQITDSQTTLEAVRDGHDDDDDTHSYASSFDTSFDLFQRMAIGSPVPRDHLSPTPRAGTRGRNRGYSLPITPRGEKRMWIDLGITFISLVVVVAATPKPAGDFLTEFALMIDTCTHFSNDGASASVLVLLNISITQRKVQVFDDNDTSRASCVVALPHSKPHTLILQLVISTRDSSYHGSQERAG